MEHIREIRNKISGETIELGKCVIRSILNKYSNTNNPIWKMIIDGKEISRNNNYCVVYECSTCNENICITLNLYMRRVNKDTKNCYLCIDRANLKKSTESTESTKSTVLSLREKLEVYSNKFLEEDPEFINNYYMRHLKEDEFERIRNKIRSINNGKIKMFEGENGSEGSKWEYFSRYKISNQTKYTPVLVNYDKQIIEKPHYIEFKCDNCDNIFVHRDLHVIKNKIKIYCGTCLLTNRTFRMRTYKLKNGEKIIWQSKPEKRFIEMCENEGILIKNGPILEYTLEDNSKHKYRVDFELPEMRMLVEIKDNHIWHLRQVKSGIFDRKIFHANLWCNINSYTFHLVFNKDLQKFKQNLMKQKFNETNL